MQRCLMAAANVHFTEYVNVFLPSSKVSADVAHRTFAGPSLVPPVQPGPAITAGARHSQAARGLRQSSRNCQQKAELCSARAPAPTSYISRLRVCGSGRDKGASTRVRQKSLQLRRSRKS